jgi:hypothetical protein
MASTWIAEFELKELIGAKEAAELCRVHGGVSHYIQTEARAEHPFAPIIGMTAMRVLCRQFGGEWVTVPNGKKAEPQKAAIVERLEKGQTQAVIAAELGVTERWVQRVASSLRRQDTQLRLPL